MEDNSTKNSIEDTNVIDTVNQDVNIYNGVLSGLKEYIETKTSNSNFDKSFDGTVVGYGSKKGLKVVINGNEYDNIECIENNYKVGDIVKLISPQNVFSDAYVVGIVNKTSNEISTPTVNWLDRFYPVGSVYLTMNDSFNPSSAFGGTWGRIASGRFLVGAGLDNGAGTYGGTVTHTHTVSGSTTGHTLETKEIPRHYHHFNETYDAADESQPNTYMGSSGGGTFAETTYSRKGYLFSSNASSPVSGTSLVYGATTSGNNQNTTSYGTVTITNHRHSFRVNGDTSANLNNNDNLGDGSHSHDLSVTTSVQNSYNDAVTEYDVMNAVYPPFLTCNMWQRTQ